MKHNAVFEPFGSYSYSLVEEKEIQMFPLPRKKYLNNRILKWKTDDKANSFPLLCCNRK